MYHTDFEKILTENRKAYVPVYETRGEVSGTFLGLAVEGEEGYFRLAPGYGPYLDRAAAQRHANELNTRLGLSSDEAAQIILGTMRAI